MKALLWKETRENLRWFPVGLLLITALCWYVHPRQTADVEFSPLARPLSTYLGVVLPILAFALGLLQSIRDLQPGPRSYLHHREVSAKQIALAKLLVGFAIYAGAVFVPLVLLMSWMAYQGMEWYPMRPAQVFPAMVLAVGAFMWHPAAMLMMARKASWWGTKWFPLVPATLLYSGLMSSMPTGGLRSAVIGIAVAVPLLAWFMAVVCTQWRTQPADPPAATWNPRLRNRLLLPLAIVAISICVICGGLAACVALWEEATRQQTYPQGYESTACAVEKASGKVALLRVKYDYNSTLGNVPVWIRGGYVESGKNIQLEEWKVSIDDFSQGIWFRDFSYFNSSNSFDGFFSHGMFLGQWNTGKLCFYDSRGRLLVYSLRPRFHLSHFIASDGFHPLEDSFKERFTVDPVSAGSSIFWELNNSGIGTPLIDGNGIYAAKLNQNHFVTLVKRKITGLTMQPAEVNKPIKLLVKDDQSLTVYRFVHLSAIPVMNGVPRSPALQIMIDPEKDPLAEDFELAEVASYPLPKELKQRDFYAFAAADNRLYLFTQIKQDNQAFIVTSDGNYEKIDFHYDSDVVTPKGPGSNEEFFMASTGMPGGIALALVMFGGDPGDGQLASLVWGSTIGFLIALLMTWFAARRRKLSQRQTMLWLLSTTLLGLAAPLSIIALYKRHYRVKCQSCNESRRVDLEHCDHCGADWNIPPEQGIEIKDSISEQLVLAG